MTDTSKIRMGMVGGGNEAFIGAVHRIAARLDGQIDLVCGALSSTPQRSLASGRALGLPDARSYPDYPTMMEAERALPAAQRMQFVSIVTPNHLHLPVAKAALAAGFHVMSDKPATRDLAEARELAKCVADSGCLYGLTYVYNGYPMVREARELVAAGCIGKLRKVIVEYLQGWLSEPETPDNKQARWRTDPAKSGIAGCMGDIGSHAANLAEYISGSHIACVCASLNAIVPGRRLDDDGAVMLTMGNDIRAVLLASQVAAGEENALSIRLYGERGGLEWQQQAPNSLQLKLLDQPLQILRAGGQHSAAAVASTRTPMGHPEGYLEAFANLYREFASAIRDHTAGVTRAPSVPGIEEGLRGMAFVEAVVNSSAQGSRWLPVDV